MEIVGDYKTSEGKVGLIEWDPVTKKVFLNMEGRERREIGTAESRIEAFSCAQVYSVSNMF